MAYVRHLDSAPSLPRLKMLQVAGENCTVWQGYDFFGNAHYNGVARQVAEKNAQCNSTLTVLEELKFYEKRFLNQTITIEWQDKSC